MLLWGYKNLSSSLNLGKREKATATHLCAHRKEKRSNEEMTLPEDHALNPKKIKMSLAKKMSSNQVFPGIVRCRTIV